MSNIGWEMIGWLGGFSIGVVADILFAGNEEGVSKTKVIGRKIMAGIIGALLGHLTVYTVRTSDVIEKIESTLISPSSYVQAHKWISEQEPDVRELFNVKIKDTEDMLIKLAEGEIEIPRNDVFNFWREAFRLMHDGDEVLATNLVSIDDWNFFGPEGAGRKQQQDAINKSVRIKRIMFVNQKNKEYSKGLIDLAKLHSEIGISVKMIEEDWLKNPAFERWLKKLGTADMVLFGDKFLLLTEVDEKKAIVKSRLTIDKEMIHAAKSFYSRLWAEAKQIQ